MALRSTFFQRSKRGCIGGGGPSMPEPAPIPVAPKPVDPVDPEVKAKEEEARAKEDKRAKLAKGRGNTIMTTPFGDESQATVQKAQVLGQGSAADKLYAS